MKVAFVSLKFSPGHIAHIRAYRELFMCLADSVGLFIAPGYRQYMGGLPGIIYTEDIRDIIKAGPDFVFMYNISTKNIPLAAGCNKAGIKSAYVLHEPRGGMKELLAEGRDIVKTVGANLVSSMICRRVDKVLLASGTGKENYERYMKGCNRNYGIYPLIFMDEYDATAPFKREYFSFIGGFTDAHACNEYLGFMEYALGKAGDMRFLIATKSDISGILKKKIFLDAASTGRLAIQAGRPMATEEVNAFYRKSICVWNAYGRSTQSGVLPNALMQGAPVIVNRNGAAREIMDDRSAGYFIPAPASNEEIMEGYRYIREHLEEMEKKARELFLRNYCYSGHIELAREVILP